MSCTPVDAEGFIEFRSLWYFGIPASLRPSVVLDVAHCAEFLLRRVRAEPESAQFRRVRSMDQTMCPWMRVVHIAASQQIIFNPAVPFSRERSVISVGQHRPLHPHKISRPFCSGISETFSMSIAFTRCRIVQWTRSWTCPFPSVEDISRCFQLYQMP